MCVCERVKNTCKLLISDIYNDNKISGLVYFSSGVLEAPLVTEGSHPIYKKTLCHSTSINNNYYHYDTII